MQLDIVGNYGHVLTPNGYSKSSDVGCSRREILQGGSLTWSCCEEPGDASVHHGIMEAEQCTDLLHIRPFVYDVVGESTHQLRQELSFTQLTRANKTYAVLMHNPHMLITSQTVCVRMMCSIVDTGNKSRSSREQNGRKMLSTMKVTNKLLSATEF